MKILSTARIALVGIVLSTSLSVLAQNEGESVNRALYIIFDGSNSMWGELPDKSRKIAVAKDVFNKLDPALLAGRDVALRLYGHRRAGDCSDTELAVPFGPVNDSLGKITKQVNAVSPKGKTPITRSLTAALEDFDGRPGDILLISDGIETCDADPCELVQAWRDNNIDIRVHVVGLGLTDLSRGAMQCISEASGTEYLDANSAGELTKAIEATATSVPPEPGEADPQPQDTGPEFKIFGEDENGNYVPVLGTIYRDGMEPVRIASNTRYVFEGGRYFINVGVQTVNGEIYLPISQEVEISLAGATKVGVLLQRPPTIRTKFIENDEEIRGVLATAFQNGREVFKLRPGEDYYVLPGTYDFVASLNQDNELKTTDTIVVGDDKNIVFQAIETVLTLFEVYAQGKEEKLRQNQELWQDGELKYKVHVHNGAVIRPGTYTLKSHHALTPYEIEDVEVPAKDNQTLEFTVSFGSVQISYVFNEQPENDGRRCLLYPIDDEGNLAARGKKLIDCDGSEVKLVAGRYFVRGWSKLGEFDDTYFDVVKGKSTEVFVQQN